MAGPKPHIKSTLEFVDDSSFSPGKSEYSLSPLALGKCSALFFCLRPPTFKDKVKKCSPKEMQCAAFCHHCLPAFITAVPILCLEQYYFNVLLKKPLTSSRKIKSLKDNKVHVCMHMWSFFGSFSAYFSAYCFISDHINILFPSSKQNTLKWYLP